MTLVSIRNEGFFDAFKFQLTSSRLSRGTQPHAGRPERSPSGARASWLAVTAAANRPLMWNSSSLSRTFRHIGHQFPHWKWLPCGSDRLHGCGLLLLFLPSMLFRFLFRCPGAIFLHLLFPHLSTFSQSPYSETFYCSGSCSERCQDTCLNNLRIFTAARS